MLKPIIEYDQRAVELLALVLDFAREYGKQDAAMKSCMIIALRHFINPPLMIQEPSA